MGTDAVRGRDRAFFARGNRGAAGRLPELGIPVLRRASGGAAIVIGPGCLMYALVLSYELRPSLAY